ncbi:MAG: DMT family transporter [Proteobacteria bacterium]|jgi:drug/metabolite transporter (DMT)-like permease|nr:DMT family transporter [Pseudomonadota bacterium]MBK9251349.1 DMT family transporter [Pseudomonadota bacterium]
MSYVVLLLVLGAIWGGSFLFMRIAVNDFGPVPLVEMRLALGSALLLPFLWRDREKFTLRRWPMMAFIGLMNSALPFLLFAWAAERAPAGVGAIANGMTALCAALMGFLFFHEKLSARQSIALVAGFAGIIVLASGKMAGMSVGWASIAGAVASLMYGLGAHMARRHLQGLPPAALAAVTLGSGALLAAPFAIATWPRHAIPMKSWLSAGALGMLCTGIAFAMFYRLIEKVGANRTTIVTYLIPPFGVAWGWLFLDEPVTLTMSIACVLILGSVALSQNWGAKR